MHCAPASLDAMRGPGLLGGMTMMTAIAVACGSRVPAPRYVGHPTSALAPVGYPPPPARVEEVPPQPDAAAVWIDGEWVWQAGRWAWRPGGWVVPPRGARFSPWTSTRDEAGNLYVAPGTWRDANGVEIATADGGAP